MTIGGKHVTLAYCFATEIAFREYSGQEFTEFLKEAATAAGEGNAPDPTKLLYAILSAVAAYSQSRGEEMPVTDTDLMYHATPGELTEAFNMVMQLRSEWYTQPEGEPEEKEGKHGKN